MNKKYFWKYLMWPLVPLVSFGGFIYPKVGLMLFPMLVLIMISGFFRGRFWCGNICPRGAFLDIPVRKISPGKKIGRFFSGRAVRIAALVMMFSVFGINIYRAFQFYGTSSFLDRLGMVGVMMCAVTTSVALILSIGIHHRTWCSFCPMGTIQKFLHSLKNRILGNGYPDKHLTVLTSSVCTGCKICSRECPLGIDVHSAVKSGKKVLDDNNCIKCGACAVKCRKNVLKISA